MTWEVYCLKPFSSELGEESLGEYKELVKVCGRKDKEASYTSIHKPYKDMNLSENTVYHLLG